jgi:hypothetical protein
MTHTKGSNPLRPMAIDLTAGIVVAIGHPSGDDRCVPARLDRVIHRPNGSVFAEATDLLTGTSGRLRWDGHKRVWVLPAHYGICGECQALSPCPREQIERDAARLQATNDPIHELETAYRGW